jgi:integrase
MSASEKIGPLTVRPHVRNGKETGKVFVDVPDYLSDTGKRRRLLFDTCEDARGFAKALLREVQARPQQTAVAAPSPKGPSTTFRKAANDWTETQELRQQAGHKRKNSLDTDKNRAKPLIAAFGNRRLDRLEDRHVLKYKGDRLAAGIGRSTINAELAVLRAILKHAGCSHLDVGFLAKSRKRYQLPTPAELERVLAQLTGRTRLAARLMAEAGLRPDEAYNAAWTWFGRHESGKAFVWVQEVSDPREGRSWMPKTAPSTRMVPLPEDLYAEIMALPRTSFWVFPSPGNPQQPIASIRKALANAVRRAGVTRNGEPMDLPPKLLRKTFGTRLAAAKVARSVIQDLVGHERGSPVTDEFYIFLEDAVLEEAVTHAQVDPARLGLATAGNRLDSKAALQAFIRAQLTEKAA